MPPVVRTGREWAGDFDLDLMAEHAAGSWTIGECKWTQRPVGVEVLRELQSRWKRLVQRQRLPEQVRYFIFSSGGFTPGSLMEEESGRLQETLKALQTRVTLVLGTLGLIILLLLLLIFRTG